MSRTMLMRFGVGTLIVLALGGCYYPPYGYPGYYGGGYYGGGYYGGGYGRPAYGYWR
jgi:hypothetical protein